MQRTFDHDAQVHLGEDQGGPDGYDNGDFFRTWLFPYQESHGYKIVLDGEILGGFIVWIFESGENRLGTIFVDPKNKIEGLAHRHGSLLRNPTWIHCPGNWAHRVGQPKITSSMRRNVVSPRCARSPSQIVRAFHLFT